MRAAKVISIIVGVLLVLIGLALLAPGGFLLGVYGTQRDASGFFETSSRVVSTSGYALTTTDVDVNIGAELGDWIPTGAKAAVRIRAASTGTGAVFIGVGPTDQVAQYLNGVAHDEVTNFGWMSASVTYRHLEGGAPSSPAAQQDFWVARQEGLGSQALEWEVLDGNWTAVIMNGDATAPVAASVSLGARFGLLLPIGIGLVVGGVVLLAVGILLIVLGARRRRPPVTAQPQYAQYAPYPPGAAPVGAAPVGAAPVGAPPVGATPVGAPPPEGQPPQAQALNSRGLVRQ